MSEREEHGGEETVCEKDLNKFGFVMFGELWDCLAYVNTVCVCVCQVVFLLWRREELQGFGAGAVLSRAPAGKELTE